MREWIIHKIFKEEKVLTTRYEFISASLNGKKLGGCVDTIKYLKEEQIV